MKPARSAGIPAAGKPVMKHRWGKARRAAGDRNTRGKTLPARGKSICPTEHRAAAEAFAPMSQSHRRDGVTQNKPEHLQTPWRHLDQRRGRSDHLATDPCSSVLPGERGCSTARVGAELHGETLPKEKKTHLPEGYGERHERIWSQSVRAPSAPPCFPFKARILGQMDPGRT